MLHKNNVVILVIALRTNLEYPMTGVGDQESYLQQILDETVALHAVMKSV